MMSDATNSSPVVLVVDDDPMILASVRRRLNALPCRLVTFENPLDALGYIETSAPAVVLADHEMPGMSGVQLLSLVQQECADTVRLMLTGSGAQTAVDAINNAGVSKFLSKPCDPEILLSTVEEALALYSYRTGQREEQLALMSENDLLRETLDEASRKLDASHGALRQANDQVSQLQETSFETQKQVLFHLGLAAEMRDATTGSHLRRMAGYTRLLAEAVGLEPELVEMLEIASTVHDVGKLAIPDAILCKPGPLTEEEWDTMRQHTTWGARILGSSRLPLVELARTVAMTHHERCDGSGYPEGLGADEIPLSGRIVAVADVFDALTSVRPYKTAMPVDDALDHMQGLGGTHLDGELLAAFIANRGKIDACREKVDKEGLISLSL